MGEHKLLPCPFCGSTPRGISQHYYPTESGTGCSNTECAVYPRVSMRTPCTENADGKTYTPQFEISDAQVAEVWNTRF